MNDLIGRQVAIDALRDAQHRFTVADEAGGLGTVKWSEDVIYFAAAERVLSDLPSAQPEQQRLSDWKEDFKDYINFLNLPRDDYNGIMEYIDEVPSAQPEIIRCKDCKHKHLENMVWACPFGLPSGENFFCGYGAEPYKGEQE